MAEMSPTPPRRRRRAPKPAGARRSMVLYLVALVIVPALAMPVFATLFSRERLQDATAARRIAASMEQVVRYEDIRSALRTEALEAGVRSITVRYGLSVEELQASLGDFPMRPVGEARTATDEAVAVVRARAPEGSVLSELETALGRARAVDDAATGGSSVPDPDAVWTVYLRYDTVYELISQAQHESIHAITTGRHGDGSPEVLAAVSELGASRELSEVLFQQMSALQGLATAPGPDQQRALIRQIESDRRVSVAQAADLRTVLSERAAAEWDDLLEQPGFRVFDGFLHAMVLRERSTVAAEGEAELVSIATPGFVAAGTAVIPVSEDVADLMGRASDRGVAAADRDARQAEQRATVAVIVTAALLVLTGALLLVVGGTMRRELLHLAAAAGRLRSGRLEPVPVEGPREIAQVAEALDDAVANLGRVAAQAELLASGQLDHPDLQEPVPGPLGSAVHASVGRLVETVRELERLRAELTHQASHDRLTGLPNRAESERLLTEALERAHLSGRQAAVFFVDLDDFKAINDTHGHAAGDHVLVTTAQRMVASVRPGDTVFRLGGDEFVVLVDHPDPEITVERATEIANRINEAVAEPIGFEGVTLRVGSSIGIALSDDLTDASVLSSKADRAMYRAKAAGQHGVQVYDEELDAITVPRAPRPSLPVTVGSAGRAGPAVRQPVGSRQRRSRRPRRPPGSSTRHDD